jgi:alkaline phosphatase D
MGPMVGHTTHNSVTLWTSQPPLQPQDAAVVTETNEHQIQVTLYDDVDTVVTVQSFAAHPDSTHVFFMTLDGLSPSTFYKYKMHLPRQGSSSIGEGHFWTAPDPNNTNGTVFDYILASCMNTRVFSTQPVWSKMVDDHHPHFALLAGDTVYLREGVDVTRKDGVSLERVWYRHQQQRQDAHFERFMAHTPMYATWNNHDYGRGYATKDQLGKEHSMKAWKLLWAHPEYASDNDGVYYSFYYGDVHFLVLDDHWNRDSAKGNRLGAAQTEWIRQQLVSSSGTFKVLVLGSDIMQRGWNSDLHNIGAIVTQNRIDGVLFHAGDIHRNEFKVQEHAGIWPYPVHQITSSGVAMVRRKPYVHVRVDTDAEDPTLTAHFYGAVDETEWANDPDLPCTSIVGDNRGAEHRCTETIQLSSLRFRDF